MSSKNYEQRTFEPSYVQIINLSNDNKRRTRGKYSKSCSDCKDTIDCVNLLSNKINKIEEIINNFKNRPKKQPELSIFNATFTLNNTPCELEYDLSNFTLDELQKLARFTTQNSNNNIFVNDHSNPFDKNEDK
ncbi:hypothetical protein RclHR1_01180013 [Rhizophagus clarus]|uniref:Uncharacterized protein n=1 Tax=Rhizophagus clarus TaxID=94130 RepID=A0A2Z6QY78_9GLOM|nr:hypothetical protein RclHR1_01180013 [Rhizophagus clarus]GES95473.1 hypothetical protein GLOIN_2v1779544 [Rhizophagus clarus]